ncbi:hypothetical protein ACFYY1_39220 [Streptomyces sp. NPDC001890]|uniref:hypothetical protein n=1 Tax=Streptomyces sp. NPDC001890 TaxID=3364620 RepID=UPI003674D064
MSTTRQAIDVMVTLLWVLILAMWPVFFAAQLAGREARRRGKPRTLRGKGWSIKFGLKKDDRRD